METLKVQKKETANSLAKKFAAERYGVLETAVFIILNHAARGMKSMPNAQSVEFEVVLNNGTQETHQVAVDVENKKVVLLH